MLKNLISDQKKVYSTHLHAAESIEPVLSAINQKENLETAVLLFEGEAQSFLLFILQNHLYATYKLIDNKMAPLLFSDYFKELSQVEGKLDLHRVSPVLFKALLALGQMEPKVVATNDLIDIERLLVHIDQKRKEALLLLERGAQVNLFYFADGTLCDAYLEETEEMRKEVDLRDKLLVYAYSSQEKPVLIVVYEEIEISPANGCGEAEKQIFTHALTEKALLGTHEADPAPSAEIPDLEKNNALSLGNAQKNPQNNREETPFDGIQHPEDMPAKKSSLSQEKGHDLWLEVLNGERVGLLIRLASERLSLGRGRADVRFNDPQISRYHAELKRSQSGLIVTDQHSTNGLFVNEKKVIKKEVALDDIIRLGDTCLKVIHAK